ncbi:hypothetical protein [Clavibacter capsici]|uniref:hypothetical protein n=1 Tax=Clavibacter capsici TaxID=1874630 RepID=UPI0035CAE00F
MTDLDDTAPFLDADALERTDPTAPPSTPSASASPTGPRPTGPSTSASRPSTRPSARCCSSPPTAD